MNTAKTLKKIEKVIKMTGNMILEYPTNPMFKVMLRGLEALKSELSQSDLNKDKLDSLHYGFMRAYEEVVVEFKNTPFGQEVDKLLTDLNKY